MDTFAASTVIPAPSAAPALGTPFATVTLRSVTSRVAVFIDTSVPVTTKFPVTVKFEVSTSVLFALNAEPTWKVAALTVVALTDVLFIEVALTEVVLIVDALTEVAIELPTKAVVFILSPPTAMLADAEMVIALTFPVRLPDRLVVDTESELMVVTPEVFWTIT